MGGPWTATSSLPGGTFESLDGLVGELQERHAGISARWIERLALRHGSDSREILGEARVAEDLGEHYGAGLTEREVAWLIEKEWARTA